MLTSHSRRTKKRLVFACYCDIAITQFPASTCFKTILGGGGSCSSAHDSVRIRDLLNTTLFVLLYLSFCLFVLLNTTLFVLKNGSCLCYTTLSLLDCEH